MSEIIKSTYGTMYYVKDMAKAVNYYKEKWGLKAAFESPEWTEFNLSGHSLCLHVARPQDQHGEGGVLIAKVSQIHQLVPVLKSQGVRVESEIKEVHPGAYCVDVRDLDGNWLSLYEDTNR